MPDHPKTGKPVAAGRGHADRGPERTGRRADHAPFVDGPSAPGSAPPPPPGHADLPATAQRIIGLLDLHPHPEGGHYRQTWIETPAPGAPKQGGDGTRPAGSCIYFLLANGERSHWHRVDATEIWHHYAGAPIALQLSETPAGPARRIILGPDLDSGARPQVIVPCGWWQAAETLGDWTLAGCTVSPAFRFEGFELAPPDFDIPAEPAKGRLEAGTGSRANALAEQKPGQ